MFFLPGAQEPREGSLRGGKYDWLVGEADIEGSHDDLPMQGSLLLGADGAPALAEPLGAPADIDLTVSDETPTEPAVEPAPQLEVPGLAPELIDYLGSDLGAETPAVTPSDDVDPVQILRDRPDVYAAFYSEFYGANNDRNSTAWTDRVGGETPEDYARYWYDTYGQSEGYSPGSGGAAAPGEDGAAPPQGRTTIDGIPLARILQDRPDVFQAFFTEYYGPNNDRHSDAWAERVGGATVEDFANYWYNAHGKLEGYVPSAPAASPEPGPEATPDESIDDAPPSEPLREEDPSLDPWNHPAIYPDWQPPYPGWRPPGSGETAGAPAEEGSATSTETAPQVDLAMPLVIQYTADSIELLPATPDQIVEEGILIGTRSLFDDVGF